MPAHLPITLIIVSDYEPGPKTWADEDAAVRAYTNDPAGAPAEIIVAAATQDEATPHPDWTGLNVRMVFIDAEASASMKDAATPDASYDLIAVIEADCVCEPGWLAALHQEMIDKPHLGAVSGTTMYRPTTALRRAASLIDRGFIRAQLANGDYYHVSNNGALYRAALLKANPYPEAVSPFVSAERRNQRMKRDGARFGYASAAIQYHEFGGWPFIADVRGNKGHQHYLTAFSGKTPVGGWLRTMIRCIRGDLASTVKSYFAYCRLTDLPILLALLVYARPFEWQGATMAKNGMKLVEGTSYR